MRSDPVGFAVDDSVGCFVGEPVAFCQGRENKQKFISNERAYIHKTIVIAVIILGIIRVNPSALLAKLFEVTPKRTAKAKNKYELTRLIK